MKKRAKEIHVWSMADTITVSRIAASFFLLFLPLRSAGFLVVYTLAGLTDVLDGWLARRTGTDGEFGARLDSMADLLFYGVLLLRLFPVLWMVLPIITWYAVSAILFIRLMAYLAAAVRYHRFVALHTWLNKLTGAAVFLIPYVLAISSGIKYCLAVCILALAASTEELVMHICRKS